MGKYFKFCKNCNKKFNPSGKFSRFCDECYKKIVDERCRARTKHDGLKYQRILLKLAELRKAKKI